MRPPTRHLLSLFLATSIAAQGGDQQPFGQGCPSGGLDLEGWAPHPGLGNLSIWGWERQPNQPVVAFLGTSDRAWNGLVLPIDLSLLGLNTCRIYTDITFTQATVANADGRAEGRWPVPNDASLAGGVLYGQQIGLQDPRINPLLPMTTSSAVALRIGPVVPFDGFQLLGDPTQIDGAPWTYRAIHNGIAHDLIGRLWRPVGSPPPGGFPAVVVSHGGGGSINGYSRGIANKMVTWGMVCIAVNYTHTDTLRYALGAPGGGLEPGGHPANVQRALRCIEILHGLGYVNADKIGAHGNSNGAFVTTALAAAAPGLLRAASHTAGGIDDARAPQYPSAATAALISVPYLIQHGEIDTTVPIQLDQDLVDVLAANGVTHRFDRWPGQGHGLGGPNSPVIDQVLARVRAWFVLQGLL